MADSTPKSYHSDPTLYLYTSLTAGSSHIITATSRLETILKANKVPFLALDVATDEKARMLWGRRAGKRKLPGLVRMGMIVGDLEEVEEWNEYGELKEHIVPGAAAAAIATPSSIPSTPSKAPPLLETPTKVRFTTENPTKASQSAAPRSPLTLAMRQAGLEAAKKASDAKSQVRTKAFEDSEASKDAVKKLENSTSPGMPAPSGTTEASSARAPENDSTTLKFTTPQTTKSSKESSRESEVGSGRKGDPAAKNHPNTESYGLSNTEEGLKNEKHSDTQAHEEGIGSGSGTNNSYIAAAKKISDGEEPEIEGHDLIKSEGEPTKGSNSGSVSSQKQSNTKNDIDQAD